jgi:sugar/nucleoside kinase (ribokinase family)
MDRAALRQSLARLLQAAPARPPVPTLVGFDGFVDQIIDVVDRRDGPDSYAPMATIADFGKRIGAAAGHSANFELVVKLTKLGGNGPIMANALARLGHPLDYVGIVGEGDAVHPAFAELQANARHITCLGAPAATDALEFSDGKLMLGKLQPLDRIDVASVDRALAAGLRSRLAGAGLVATVNWTMALSMTAIWRHLARNVLPGLRNDRPLWFVDLADPAKRSVEDLRDAMAALGELQAHVDVVLGVNEAEARQVLAALGASWNGGKDDVVEAERACGTLRQRLGLHGVVCHMVKCAAAAVGSASSGCQGFFTPKPRITTGAGDHFNAGFTAGLAAGLPLAECCLMGTATSGYYVRTMVSPTRAQLVELLTGDEP